MLNIFSLFIDLQKNRNWQVKAVHNYCNCLWSFLIVQSFKEMMSNTEIRVRWYEKDSYLEQNNMQNLHLSSLSIAFLSEGLFFFGGTGGHTFPQMSWMLRLIWQLRAAALVRIRSMAVIPSPWAWRLVSGLSSQDADREFCLDDIFWCSLTRRDSMLSRISRISVTSWGGVPAGTQRVEELLGLTTWAASVLFLLIISWNFLLRSATRLNTWASRRF